jgi:hypothetical protein
LEVKLFEQLHTLLIVVTGVQIFGLEDGWKEAGKVHELFPKTKGKVTVLN